MTTALDLATFSAGVVAGTWREAVRAAGLDLVNARAVGAGYVDEMVRLIEEIGPWCVVAPGVAVPHARPGGLVRREALAIVTLDEPVTFGHPHYDPVDIVIATASLTNAGHIRQLASIANVLDRPGTRDALRAAATRDDAVGVLAAAA